jgi:hypothetical protein
MEIVSGMKIAAAIDDLATNDLENAEQEMAEQLAEEISETFGVDPGSVPQRLINGMMRGSTSLKIDQIVEEIHRMQGRINDSRDAEALATRILNSVEQQRKGVHRQRIQRSAIRQVLRALSSDSLRSPGIEDWNSSSIFRLQSELNDREIHGPHEVYEWASAVLRLYQDIFVESGERDSSLTRKSRGLVSQGAAKNYSSAWTRFIEENEAVIFSHAEQSYIVTDKSLKKQESEYIDPISSNLQKISITPPSFAQETSVAKDSPARFSTNQSLATSIKHHSENVSVTVSEFKNGEKPKRIEQNWPSKENALMGLGKFFIVIESFVPNKSRIDQVEISITVNEQTETLTLEEIDPAGLKSMLQALLTS